MTQNQNKIHRTILVPNKSQSQIASAPSGVSWGSTVIQQCQLSTSSPSPVTLTFSSPVNVGDTVNVVVQVTGDTVASVTDDVGNSYTQLLAATDPTGQYFEVWTSPSVIAAPSGVVVATTGGSDILAAMLSEINTA
jgi:hypothetical protein